MGLMEGRPEATAIALELTRPEVHTLLAALSEYTVAVKREGGRPSAVAMAMGDAALLIQKLRNASERAK